MKKEKKSEKISMKLPHCKRKGFSLVESLIAIAIFSLVSVMIAGTFSSLLKNYANEKRTQRSIEGAQYAMNIMAKSLRTSSVLGSNGSSINIYDFSQGKCIQYNYIQTEKKIIVGSAAPLTSGDPSTCDFASISNKADMTSASIESASISGFSSAGTNLGRVTVSLRVKETGQTTSTLPIQMSVSLRQ